ncbi:MAG: hypothetical protein ACT4O5_12215 [Gammaproteobacteria bacterium]
MYSKSRRRLAMSCAILMTMAACAKKPQDEPPAAADAAAPAETAAPAAPAPAAPAPAAPAATVESTAATDEKAAAIEAAMAEDVIVSDPRGQWAVSATASSTYAGDKTPDSRAAYAPSQVAGAPNVERYGDNANAWVTETADKGIEWLEVKFARPVQATQLRVRQNSAPGAIIKLELIDEAGARQPVWQGVDDRQYAGNAVAWFDKTFEKTPYKVTGARITLATNAVSGWNEIDAVQLLGD